MNNTASRSLDISHPSFKIVYCQVPQSRVKNAVACFDFEIEKHAYKGEMQALTHSWITKTKTMHLHKQP